jgi:DNA-binding PadR family transcriptional regulator
MKPTVIPLLGYALLGLIQQKPSSGYDLRKIFAETAMGNYSSSPGAIYPALERLETAGLIQGTVEETGGMRRRRLYRLSPKGLAALKGWLAHPIKPGDVQRGAADLMLRFSFMERVLGTDACIEFLESFRSALSDYLSELKAFLAANGASMPLSARLAFESGIRGYFGLHEWTAYALKEFRTLQPTTHSHTTKPATGGHR